MTDAQTASSGVSFYDTPLDPEEFESRVRDAIASLDGPEGIEIAESIDWFLRHYPEPLDRLRYARRKWSEAERFRGAALSGIR